MMSSFDITVPLCAVTTAETVGTVTSCVNVYRIAALVGREELVVVAASAAMSMVTVPSVLPRVMVNCHVFG